MLKADVVVIGGGILGAAAALSLSEAGFDTVILEKNETVSGASGANFGMLTLYERPETWHWPMALESFTEFEKIQKKVDIGLSFCGGTYALDNSSEANEAEKKFVVPFRDTPVRFQWLDREGISRKEPYLEAERALYYPQEGKLNPIYATIAILDLAREKGARLFPHCPAVGFDTAGRNVKYVLTPEGKIRTKWVVNAAGSWAGEVSSWLGENNPVRYHKGAAMVTEPVPPVIRGIIVSGFLTPDLSLGRESSLVAATVQSEEGSVLIAQATVPSELEDRSVSYCSVSRNAKKYLRYFPALKDLVIIRTWAAQTPYTVDGMPVFGFHDDWENFLTVSGFRGAFSVAPAVGRQVANVLRQQETQMLRKEFSPARG